MYYNADLPPRHIGEWSQMHDDPETAVDPNAWRGNMTSEQIRRARAGYYGEISFIDTQIGRLMNWITDKRNPNKNMKNTWFIFTSDHGDMQGDHNLWRKTYAYEGSTRIPFLVVPPLTGDRPKRPVADEVVELRDIMPTVLEAAGVAVPDTVDGMSLLPLLDRPAENWRRYIHGEHCTCYSVEQEMQFVTDGRRKFIWLPRLDLEQFFDLEKDPGETRNLINDPAYEQEINTWRGYLIREFEKRDCGWVENGKLQCPADEPLVSPHKNKRWTGRE
jgi:arylsulfatase A-like enzyme